MNVRFIFIFIAESEKTKGGKGLNMERRNVNTEDDVYTRLNRRVSVEFDTMLQIISVPLTLVYLTRANTMNENYETRK